MQVYQFISPVTGRPVNNHIIMQDADRIILTSYRTKVASVELDKGNNSHLVLVPEALEYSRTTTKYILQFAWRYLPDAWTAWLTPAALRKAIKAKEVIIAPIV